jgi:hypothetical protein
VVLVFHHHLIMMRLGRLGVEVLVVIMMRLEEQVRLLKKLH